MVDLLLVSMCFIVSLTLSVQGCSGGLCVFFMSSYCHLVILFMGCKGC